MFNISPPALRISELNKALRLEQSPYENIINNSVLLGVFFLGVGGGGGGLLMFNSLAVLPHPGFPLHRENREMAKESDISLSI